MDSPDSHASPHQNDQPEPAPGTEPPEEPCALDELNLEFLKYVLAHSLSREDAWWYLGISENTFLKRCRQANLAFTGLYRGRRLTQKEMLDGFFRSRNPPLREEMRKRLLGHMELTVAVVGDGGRPEILEHYQLVPRPSA